MIRNIAEKGKSPFFVLETENTSYLFRIMETGQPEHVYYGRKIRVDHEDEAQSLVEKHAFAPGNSVLYDQEHPSFSLEDVSLEMSGEGKGDYREPMISIVSEDGSRTTDFVYQSFDITTGKAEFETLPGSYDSANEVQQLTVFMRDQNHGYGLELHYWVYEDCDVITRNVKIINSSESQIHIERALSMLTDFRERDLTVTSFHGGWAREMGRYDVNLTAGKFVNESNTGSSSSRSNPFTMAARSGATEDQGDVFGFNLIYSGNHYTAMEVSSYGKTRIVIGIQPRGFGWKLEPEEFFETPEAVMTFSNCGYNGMSQNMHTFVKKHILRGKWAKKDRPILLNSWEANYFDINERKLLSLAKAGKEAGMELFVMDDGWFGTRDDDTQSLGDWTVNKNKLPGSLGGICRKINSLGLDFGIWVEPEMVNVKSELYRAHPDWTMEIPGMSHSEGRNQRILDFANPAVVEYMTEQMRTIFSSAPIVYVKWDMNRIFSDVYSPYLPKEQQGECAHRYILGLYRMMKILTEEFPDILFEGCAAGGNRFDLGILSYFPQIWASDDSDAAERLSIQTGYSYGYPQCTYTAHVSACPNHQTLRVTPMETRFNAAAFGVFGYELNLTEMSQEQLAEIKAQVELYKKYRHTLQYGNFYRGRAYGNIWEWTVASEDQKTAIGMLAQKEMHAGEPRQYFIPKGLNEEIKYHFYNRELKFNVKKFGSLINTAAPFHVKQDSIVHNIIAKFVKMDSEKENYTSYGDALMYGGIELAPAFVGTGFNENVRYFPDYGSRLYFMEEVEN